MENCIFCKIIAGVIPSPRLYEDDKMIIIRDIQPKAKLHYLCIPKTHFSLLSEMDEARAEMLGLLTLINLAGDGAEFLSLHLPPKWRKYREILSMDATGAWRPAAFEATEDGILLTEGADYLHPVHLLFR